MQPYYNCIVLIIYTILYYLLVLIFLQSICIIFLLQQKYSAPLQLQGNWCQPPLTTARHPSRDNGGAPVPEPSNVGLTIPPPSHQRTIQSIHPIQPVANQPGNKIQFLIENPRLMLIRSSQYDTANTIQTIQSIQSSLYDPSSVSSEGKTPTRPSLIRKTHLQLPQLLVFHPPQRSLPPDIFSLPHPLHIMLPSLLRIEIAPSPRLILWPF